MAANKNSSASNHPRLSENFIKPAPTQPLHAAGPVHYRHQEYRPQVPIPVPKVSQRHHHHSHHHHHDSEDEEDDTEIPGPTQFNAAPKHVHNRPAINRGIAVNIAFRIAALDIDCEGYMYMLTQTGDHECGHPILPVKARGCEWRAFRDDMLVRFGWGSVLSATWLQSYNWACKVLNIEVDRILVGIDTQTSLVNAAKSQIGLDSAQDNAWTGHTCLLPDPSTTTATTATTITRPSTTAQTSTSAQLSVSAPNSIPARSKMDRDAESISPTALVPSASMGAKSKSKASTSTSASGSKTNIQSSDVADSFSSVSDERPKSGDENDTEEIKSRNPLEVIYSTFRARILQETAPPPPDAAVDPIPKTVIPSPATGSSTSSSSSSPSSAPKTSTSPSSKNPQPPPSLPSLLHSASAGVTTSAITANADSNADSPSTTTTPTTTKRKPRHRKRKHKSPSALENPNSAAPAPAPAAVVDQTTPTKSQESDERNASAQA